MTKIAIIGVGLIGGSLALCFKGKPELQVVGFSNHSRSVQKYLERGVVDHATTSLEEACADADFIFLCPPVGMIESYLTRLRELPLKTGCIITDAGSTKGSIVDCARDLDFRGAYFIGGHPMAGSERSGVEAATSHLFENAYYVLTPDQKTPEPVYRCLTDLLKYTKAHIIKVEPRLHDEIVGAISHLPHVIAVALVNQIAAYEESEELYSLLAAGGFRDITRIASSDPVMWRDILIDNRMVLLDLLKDWNLGISHFMQLLQNADADGIEEQFKKANAFRRRLPERRKGLISPALDLYIDVPDTPGVIGQICTLLGNEKVNLSNIQIMESRLDVPGVLRLSFRDEAQMNRARDLLVRENYIPRT
jgi:prephenate dehydrogenase